MTYAPTNSQNNFLPANFDIPPDVNGIRLFLDKRERLTASIVNVKENSQYEKVEKVTGQQWFSQVSNNAVRTMDVYRLTFDLVSLNGGPIGAGATAINLQGDPTVNQPVLISFANALVPVHGFGACTTATNFYFINDPLVFVTTNNMTTVTQTITITNNTGANLTQCYWVFEYIKT